MRKGQRRRLLSNGAYIVFVDSDSLQFIILHLDYSSLLIVARVPRDP